MQVKEKEFTLIFFTFLIEKKKNKFAPEYFKIGDFGWALLLQTNGIKDWGVSIWDKKIYKFNQVFKNFEWFWTNAVIVMTADMQGWGKLWTKQFLRFFDTNVAQPGSVGQDRLAVSTHVVIAYFTLVGENRQTTQRLLASATAPLAVTSTATLGPFPFDLQQLRLQLPEINNQQPPYFYGNL